MRNPVVVDCCDALGVEASRPGAALALLYLLGIESSEVLGVTTTFGGAPVDVAHRRIKWFLRMLGREEIPVFSGAPAPSRGSTEAAHFLAKTVRGHPGEIMVITLGPWSNLVAASDIHEGFLLHLRKLVCLGGWSDGKPPHPSERGIGGIMDPEAVLRVLSSGSIPAVITEDLYGASLFPRNLPPKGFWPEWLDEAMGRALRRTGSRRAVFRRGPGRLLVPEILPAVYIVRPELFEDRTRTFAPTAEDLSRGMAKSVDSGRGVRVNTPLRVRSPQTLAEHVVEAWSRALGG